MTEKERYQKLFEAAKTARPDLKESEFKEAYMVIRVLSLVKSLERELEEGESDA